MNYEDRVTKEYVEGLLAGGVKIATGSYVGTGEYGAEHPSHLSFPFAPKAVWVYSSDIEKTLSPFFPQCRYATAYMGGQTQAVYVTFEGTELSWYHRTSETLQFNWLGRDYYWFAIG